MTFLPKPERNSIWVFAHDAPDQPRHFFDREPWYTP